MKTRIEKTASFDLVNDSQDINLEWGDEDWLGATLPVAPLSVEFSVDEKSIIEAPFEKTTLDAERLVTDELSHFDIKQSDPVNEEQFDAEMEAHVEKIRQSLGYFKKINLDPQLQERLVKETKGKSQTEQKKIHERILKLQRDRRSAQRKEAIKSGLPVPAAHPTPKPMKYDSDLQEELEVALKIPDKEKRKRERKRIYSEQYVRNRGGETTAALSLPIPEEVDPVMKAFVQQAMIKFNIKTTTDLDAVLYKKVFHQLTEQPEADHKEFLKKILASQYRRNCVRRKTAVTASEDAQVVPARPRLVFSGELKTRLDDAYAIPDREERNKELRKIRDAQGKKNKREKMKVQMSDVEQDTQKLEEEKLDVTSGIKRPHDEAKQAETPPSKKFKSYQSPMMFFGTKNSSMTTMTQPESSLEQESWLDILPPPH